MSQIMTFFEVNKHKKSCIKPMERKQSGNI